MTNPRSQLIKLLLKGDPEPFHAFCREVEPEKLDINGATFRELHLSNFDLRGFNLSNTEWANCTMSALHLDGADLSGAYIHGSALVDCSAINAQLAGAALDGSVLRSTRFEACNWTDAELDNNQLLQCTLEGGVFEDISFNGLILEECQLAKIQDISGEIGGMLLRRCTLTAVDFTGAQTRRCARQGCTIDAETKLPDTFKVRSGRRRTV